MEKNYRALLANGLITNAGILVLASLHTRSLVAAFLNFIAVLLLCYAAWSILKRRE